MAGMKSPIKLDAAQFRSPVVKLRAYRRPPHQDRLSKLRTKPLTLEFAQKTKRQYFSFWLTRRQMKQGYQVGV